MKRLAQLLRDIRDGRSEFKPDSDTLADTQRFQPDAERLIDAQKSGYLGQVAPHLVPVGTRLGYKRVSIIRGLTFEGEQFLAEHLEDNPDAENIRTRLRVFRSEHVSEAWSKALERVDPDPRGAITAARTLLETIFKQVLTARGVVYSSNEDFGVLWKKVTQCVDLQLSSNEEESTKRFMSACNSLIGSLSELRNRSGDAHGSSTVTVTAIHARLVVNVAGSLAGFLADIVEPD